MAKQRDIEEIMDDLKLILCTTVDEDTPLRVWRLMRKLTLGPLFVVEPLPLAKRPPREVTRCIMEAHLDMGSKVNPIARLLHLDWRTVAKARDRWQAMTPAEKQARRVRWQALRNASLATVLTKEAEAWLDATGYEPPQDQVVRPKRRAAG